MADPKQSPLVNTDPTANYIAAGAAGISALSSGLNYYKSAGKTDLPGVSGAQKLGAANQGAVAQNLMNPQGLSDTQFNRLERGVTEQSASLVADITAQARDTLFASPLALDAMVDQALDKAASIKQAGIEKIGLFDVETVVQNSLASIQATQAATKSQEKITEQQREIAAEERALDRERSKAFQSSILGLSKSLAVALGSNPAATPEENFITDDLPDDRSPEEQADARNRMLNTESGLQTDEERSDILRQNVIDEKQDIITSDVDTIIRDADEAKAVSEDEQVSTDRLRRTLANLDF